jgi:ribonucleotide reductase alpha subunit
MNKNTPWGELGYITYKRTYARKLNELSNLTEEFSDSISRVIKACKTQLKCGFSEQEEQEISEILSNLEGSVAGRFWWQLGTKTVSKLGLLSLQNCAFVTVDSIRAFTWAMDALMLGSGVGFNIQRKYVYQLPKVKKAVITRQDTKDADFIVPDTRGGWIKLLEEVLNSHFVTGKGFSYSTILIRGKGTPIKGFGGVASGPEELCEGIAEISKILNLRYKKQLRPIDALDIMNVIGSIVVAGNVRRSAEIAIGDCDDLQYLASKTWSNGNIPNYRAMSNNSVVCNDINVLPEQFWDGYKGNGEPFGLINLSLSRQVGRLGEIEYPDPEVAGFNPCFHPDTLVSTVNGPIKISEITEPTYVYTMLDNGSLGIKKSSAAWLTRKNAETLKIKVNSGSELIVTPEHKIFVKDKGWVEAKDLKVKDQVVHLSRARRGACYAGIRLTSQQPKDQKMEHRLIWEGIFGKIPQNHDIHHINGNTHDNTIENLQCLPHQEHAKLTALEQPNNHQVHGDDGNFISGPFSLKGAKTVINLPKEQQTGLINSPLIVSIESGPITDVYDITVEGTHNLIANNIVAHNCAEQSLAPYETCCLAEIFLPNITSQERLLKVSKYLYRICKHSLLLPCHLEETESIVHKNMRMGIGVTGYLQASEEQKSWLAETYKQLREFDKEYSEKLKVPISIKLTTVKPSGTLSLLAGVTAGIHPAYSKYYIRRIRIASNSPLAGICRKHGYHSEYQKNFDGTEDRNTVVVSFPICVPENTTIAKDMTAIKQLEVVKKLQTEWSDNAVSCTVYYKKEELLEIKSWLKENYNNYVKSVSFLLHSEHGFQQAPYEEINQEQYEEYKKLTLPIISGNISEEDMLDSFECIGGVCPVK